MDKLIRWDIEDEYQKPMQVQSILDDYEGFRIIMKHKTDVLKVAFENPLSYRVTDEAYLLKLWHHSDKELLKKTTFYLIHDSSYAEFFHNMTEGLYSEWNVKHYAIYSDQDCIDILSEYPPILSWL